MRLRVTLPTSVLFDGEVKKINTEATNGAFTILPRHIDFTTALVPGLLSLTTPEGREIFLAIDEGILVKRGSDVMISTRNALRGSELGKMREAVEEHFRRMDEREKRARSALVRMEADFIRRFVEIRETE
jgi:F-type H+-transporting ATPase subunit epsilon